MAMRVLRGLGIVAVIVAAVFAVFRTALDAELLNWDDIDGIANNAKFRGLGWDELRWMFTTNLSGPYQPLSWLSLAIDHALWGLEPGLDAPAARGFHLTNVALHAAVAVLLFVLVREGFALRFGAERERREPWPTLAALGAALFFALHPLRCESVAWVTERRDVLSGLFAVAAVWAWLRWARPRFAPGAASLETPATSPASAWGAVACALAVALFHLGVDRSADDHLAFAEHGELLLAAAFVLLVVGAASVHRRAARAGLAGSPAWLALALFAFLLSLLAKAAAMALPAVLLAIELWLAHATAARDPRRRAGTSPAPGAWRVLGESVLEKFPFVALALVFASLAVWGQRGAGLMVAWADHGLSARLAQAAYGAWFYPLATLAPLRLSPIYDLPRGLSLAEPLHALAFAAACAVVVVLALRRRRVPGLACAAACYLVLIAPVLGLAQCGPQLVADRYSYLACLPFAWLFGAAIGELGRARWRLACGVVWLGALGVLAERQTRIWRDSESLWTHALALAPESPIANAGLAHVRKTEGFAERDATAKRAKLEEALELYSRADPDDPRWMANRAVIEVELAAAATPDEREALRSRAVANARRALELARGRGEPGVDYLLTVGVALHEAGHAEEALDGLRAYVEAFPASFLGWANLGIACLKAGRNDEAVRALRRAVELDGTQGFAWSNLGLALEGVGDSAGAVEAYRRLLELRPGDASVEERLKRARAASR